MVEGGDRAGPQNCEPDQHLRGGALLEGRRKSHLLRSKGRRCVEQLSGKAQGIWAAGVGCPSLAPPGFREGADR